MTKEFLPTGVLAQLALTDGDRAGVDAANMLLRAVADVPHSELVEWWGDVLMVMVDCCESTLGAEHTQMILAGLKAQGASTGN